MTSRKMAVFGIYATSSQAERAVDALMAAGFTSPDISVLLPDTQSTQAFAHHKDTKAPEGTAVGVTAGGAIGGVLGVLAGIGILAIPGVGPLIAAGPIMAGLAGLGVGGAVGRCSRTMRVSRAGRSGASRSTCKNPAAPIATSWIAIASARASRNRRCAVGSALPKITKATRSQRMAFVNPGLGSGSLRRLYPVCFHVPVAELRIARILAVFLVVPVPIR